MEASALVFLAKLSNRGAISDVFLDRRDPRRKEVEKIRDRGGGGCVGKADVTGEGSIGSIGTVERMENSKTNVIDSACELLDLQSRKHGWAHLM